MGVFRARCRSCGKALGGKASLWAGTGKDTGEHLVGGKQGKEME